MQTVTQTLESLNPRNIRARDALEFLVRKGHGSDLCSKYLGTPDFFRHTPGYIKELEAQGYEVLNYAVGPVVPTKQGRKYVIYVAVRSKGE